MLAEIFWKWKFVTFLQLFFSLSPNTSAGGTITVNGLTSDTIAAEELGTRVDPPNLQSNYATIYCDNGARFHCGKGTK
jgi:hypothetical protein